VKAIQTILRQDTVCLWVELDQPSELQIKRVGIVGNLILQA